MPEQVTITLARPLLSSSPSAPADRASFSPGCRSDLGDLAAVLGEGSAYRPASLVNSVSTMIVALRGPRCLANRDTAAA